MVNPFNVGFGEKPNSIIERKVEYEDVINTFTSINPSFKSVIIAGARGSGKTVLLSILKHHFDSLDDFITIDLNPFMEMHEQLAAKLYDKAKLKKLFAESEFSFSFHGLSFSIKGKNPITNVNSLLEVMFNYLKKKNIRVVITIDDIDSNDNVKSFIYSYQSFLREEFRVFLMMSGLYENISSLENTKNLTFLLRTPKIYLDKLNLRAITKSYENIFNINEDDALKLAKTTSGYAYGYQLLGDILYRNGTTKISKKILDEFDLKLEENVYAKIWSTLGSNEKKIIYAMTKTSDVANILSQTKLSNSSLQVYKKMLSKKGIIDINVRGKIYFNLPRFKEFVEFRIKLEEVEEF